MLWGIVTRSNVDYAELLWEEFVQAIQTFFTHRANLNIPTKKPTPHFIPYYRFTKLIIYYLGSRHNIHRRPVSPVHVTGDDFLLGNLKFVPKGKKDEVFGKPIPQELITEAIQESLYYQQYLEMATRKPITKEGGKKKTASKADKPKKHAPAKQHALVKQTKPAKEKTSNPFPSKKIRKGKVTKVRKGKSSHQLVDDEEEAPVGGVAIREPISKTTRKLQEVKGKGKGIVTDKQAALSLLDLQKPKNKSVTDQLILQRQTPVTQDVSTGPSAQPQDDTSANVVPNTSSLAYSTNDAETGADKEQSNSEMNTKILNIDEEQGEEVSKTVALEEKINELDEGQAGSDPGKTPESQPQPEYVLMEEDHAGSDPGKSHVAQAGPNPKPINEDFIATVYPKVHESLKLTTEEQVHIENPSSSSGTLSSMKNLEDVSTFGDQFLNDNVFICSSIIIDLSPPKPSSPPVQEIFITTTTTTTTRPLPPPPLIQSLTDSDLATRVFALEKRSADFEKKTGIQDKTLRAFRSRVYTLENHDLYSKIDKTANEVFKEAVHTALQAPLRECFRDLNEAQMKEILRDRMFESGSYRSHPEHATLYEALEASMDRDNREEFLEETSMSRKRRRDD
ncbi:hypothetical protein Tco_0015403 [Tanacetum coccineum]